jgi:hypothetical protein
MTEINRNESIWKEFCVKFNSVFLVVFEALTQLHHTNNQGLDLSNKISLNKNKSL